MSWRSDLETGLIGGPEKREIKIERYNPRWPEIYEVHKEKVSKAFSGIEHRTEHIGSTSVNGLAAKPIVDMLVVISDPGNEKLYREAMENQGYQLRVREPDFDEHRMFRTFEQDVHIHVFPEGSKEVERYLLFRDHLRRHADVRSGYEALKRKQSEKNWSDMNAYAEAKTEFIETIICEAKRGVQ
ncbi:GrpB family protein [Pseudovibrio japonicus]|nr:GrpB family protein [Pseudovibrio japonicus]